MISMHKHMIERGARAVVSGCILLLGLTVRGPADLEARASDPPATAARPTTLYLANGDYVAGDLKDSDRAGSVRWQGSAFAEPFTFPVEMISAIHFPTAERPEKPTGDYCFELAGGDMLFGSLRELTADHAEIDSPRLGRFRVARTSIQRINRWRDSADLLYLGPNGLHGWRDARNKQDWREDAGHLETEVEGAAAFGEFDLPPCRDRI